MRIDLNSSVAVSGSQIERPSSSQTAQGNKTQNTASQNSESDLKIGRLAAAALSEPDVRTEKVQALQSQIEAGKYQVSAGQVVAAMFEQMRVRA